MEFVPHEYQKRAIALTVEKPKIGLFLDMGLGKTVITLTALWELIYDRFDVSKVLVIAPKRVAEDTWSREHEKWDHLKDLRVSKVLGSAKLRQQALEEEADIYVIGRDCVKWLVYHYLEAGVRWPFDTLVVDELSSFKNPRSQRFKYLRRVLPYIRRVIGLTGTPSPNGLMDLWAEVYLLDTGQRLGPTLGAYREKYFRPGSRNGYTVFKWEPTRTAQKEIEEKISDICISMRAEDYLTLPRRIDNRISVALSKSEMAAYRRMEQEQLLQLEEEGKSWR